LRTGAKGAPRGGCRAPGRENAKGSATAEKMSQNAAAAEPATGVDYITNRVLAGVLYIVTCLFLLQLLLFVQI
jgi:hypothetical protein